MIQRLTPEQIDIINRKCPSDQGIFVEPYGIPHQIKSPVIYGRFESGGYSGGSCWASSNPQPYTCSTPKDRFKVLDILLKEIYPSISYMQFREIESEIQSSETTSWEYYGNCTDYVIDYLPLNTLYEILERYDQD